MNQKNWLARFMVTLGLACLLFAASSVSKAQIVSGTISGTVEDENKAALTGVTITVTNTGTQLKRNTVTDDSGNYAVPQLPPGIYTVTAEQQGFKTATSSNVTLEVDQRMRLDLTMVVGEVSEAVEVEAVGTILETESPSLGQVIDEKRTRDLPLNGRNFLQLATLAPGSVPILSTRSSTAAQVTGRQTLSVNINGGRDDTNSFLIDGVESRQPWLGTPSILPSVDAIQEFKVQRSLFSAEYGQGTAIINLSIKPGTREFHGTLFEFLRNNRLDARNFFDPGPAPPFKQNQFGGTLGGPIYIPGAYNGKQRGTFFFVNYEGFRSRRNVTLIGNVPTPAQLAGNFAGLPPVRNPFTGQPFPNNVIPDALISNFARLYRQYIPAPNRNVAGANYITAPAQRNDFDQFNARVDQQFGASDSGFIRYSINDGTFIIPGLAPLYGQNNPLSGQSIALQETHIFGPRVVNVAKFGYNRGLIYNRIENTTNDLGTELGLKNLDNRPIDYGLPTVNIGGFGQLISNGTIAPFGEPFLNQGSTSNLFQLSDTISIIQGKHTITTGADIRYQQFQVGATLFRQGYNLFLGFVTGNSVADFLLGIPTATLYQHGEGGGNLRSTSYNFFVQDDYKVRQNLTLNLGLRYEYNSPYTEIDDRQGFFDTTVPGGQLRLLRDPKEFGFQATSPLISFGGGLRRGIVNPDRNNFAPRVGFAYTPTPDMVIRGGYGIFYAAVSANEYTFPGTVPPFVISPAIPRFTSVGSLYPNVNSPTFNVTGISTFSIDPNARTPYVQQWNFSVQRTFFRNAVVEIGYVGAKGTHLWERININSARLPTPGDPNPAASLPSRRPFPNFGDVLQASFRENSNYNALQARIDKRFSRGFSFLAAYTYGKSIDTASGGFFTSSHQDRTNLDAERARSNFDVRHAFTFSHSYELPFGRGKSYLSDVSSAANKIIGGWQINGILTLLSGQPFSVLVNGDVAVVGAYTAQRANRIADGNLPSGQRTPDRWFDTSAFTTPAAGTFGNSGRNILDGPGYNQYDFSIFKNTALGERFNLQFRTEIFNLFNHTNFNLPSVNVNVPASFGKITSARNPREIQFAVKLIF